MNRRGFLGTLTGTVLAGAVAVREWPFRVYSFPKEVKLFDSSQFLTIEQASQGALDVLKESLNVHELYKDDRLLARAFETTTKIGELQQVLRVPVGGSTWEPGKLDLEHVYYTQNDLDHRELVIKEYERVRRSAFMNPQERSRRLDELVRYAERARK